MTAGDAPTFRALLRKHRLAAAFSQEELAERAGLSYRGVGDLERGTRREPRLDTVRRLADALELEGAAREEFIAAARGQAEPLVEPVRAPVAGNLPLAPNSFVGRETELAELAGLLTGRSSRVVTILGPGGMGKTRLSLETARACASAFPDGVFFVPLAPLTDASDVTEAIRLALKLDEGPEDEPPVVASWIGNRRLLLVLDNFEHVLGAAPVV